MSVEHEGPIHRVRTYRRPSQMGKRIARALCLRPAAWKPVASQHRDALGVFRAVTDLDWTYVSPAAVIEPGARTGKFRLGGDDLLVDDQGQSRVSMEDYAKVIVDELESPKAIRRRITVAY